MKKIVVTGGAGLLGQNLVVRLKAQSDIMIVGIDKHVKNCAIFRELHPAVTLIEADLSRDGDWTDAFADCDTLIMCHAQIGGLNEAEFIANNITATQKVLAAANRHNIAFVVHISSSVVNSMAVDNYTETKKAQEALLKDCAIPHIILRPTLMFGWFDRKHLGWLRRFMDRSLVFPIPGDGHFIRQPLYVGDFVAIILSAVQTRKTGVFDISGLEQIPYAGLIGMIHQIVKPKARLVHIPYTLFWMLLWTYALFDKNPPFTTHQLKALVQPDTFPVIDWPGEFQLVPTSLYEALEQTFLDPDYAPVSLAF
jgi:nucleoside-diphosphate-sugar epimerase